MCFNKLYLDQTMSIWAAHQRVWCRLSLGPQGGNTWRTGAIASLRRVTWSWCRFRRPLVPPVPQNSCGCLQGVNGDLNFLSWTFSLPSVATRSVPRRSVCCWNPSGVARFANGFVQTAGYVISTRILIALLRYRYGAIDFFALPMKTWSGWN